MTTNDPRSGGDAVGAYRDPKGGSTSMVPWIVGGIVLLLLLLLALWLFGAFSGDDELEMQTPGDLDTTITTPAETGTTE